MEVRLTVMDTTKIDKTINRLEWSIRVTKMEIERDLKE